MKPLRDVSWPHFKPTENLHSTRSNPSFKASSTVYLQPEKVNGSDPSFRRLSEGARRFDEPVRELSPRPEPDSRTVTPKLAPKIPEQEPTINIITSEPHPGTFIPEINSKGLTPSISTEELNCSEAIPSVPSRHYQENVVGLVEAHLPSSPSLSAKEVSASLNGLQLAVTAMGLRGSGTISPLSDGSINDLIQSMPDSPVSEQPTGQLQSDTKWKTSKQIPRIDVSESSMDEPLTAFLPLSNDSDAASTIPTLQSVPSNHPVLVAPGILQRMVDGPASIATVTRDYSHAPGDCPTISESDESKGDTTFPLDVKGLAKMFPEPLIADNRLPLSTLENVPMVDGSSPKYKLPGVPDIPGAPVVPRVEAPGLPGPSPILVMPGLPVDATGLASAPITPPPNLNKKQKLKVKSQRAIRKCRRIVMRRSVMTVLLGRQLAGPTVDSLKLISKSGKGVVGAATSLAPVPMPI